MRKVVVDERAAEVRLRRSRMGIGDYICLTLRGGAPWGFTLREGEGDTYRPFLVSQVCISVRLLLGLEINPQNPGFIFLFLYLKL